MSSGETRGGGRIAPCLWFDDQAEQAAAHYVGIFPDARQLGVQRYPESFDNPSGKPRGSVMAVEFELAGTRFTALNGGPMFTINPTISFFATAPSIEATERMATALADGGTFLMELGEYPWSPSYAWVQDRFGVSWQVMLAAADAAPSVVPCLMFAGAAHGRAEEALRAYASAFPGGNVEVLERYGPGEGPEGTLKHGRASLDGQALVTMDSHLEHNAQFNEGLSLQIMCTNQDEIDHYWAALTEGGEEGPCGWLKDRFGVSWQVVPADFAAWLNSSHGSGPGYERAFAALMEMKKIDIAALNAAAGR